MLKWRDIKLKKIISLYFQKYYSVVSCISGPLNFFSVHTVQLSAVNSFFGTYLAPQFPSCFAMLGTGRTQLSKGLLRQVVKVNFKKISKECMHGKLSEII